jgi:hypothetical protein
MLINKSGDVAGATATLGFATHVPKHRANGRAIASTTDGFANVTIGKNVTRADDHLFA